MHSLSRLATHVVCVVGVSCSATAQTDLTRPEASRILNRHEFFGSVVDTVPAAGDECLHFPQFSITLLRSALTARFVDFPTSQRISYAIDPSLGDVRGTRLETFSSDTLSEVRVGRVRGRDARSFAACAEAAERIGSKSNMPIETLMNRDVFIGIRTTILPHALAAGIPRTGGKFEIARKVLTEVTGITKRNPNEASVEFTYEWQLTAIGEKALKPVKGGNTVMSATASFRLYDDGWRIANIGSVQIGPSKKQ
jgi:hypothetical protein